jgi:large subunit ribosomal protein L19
MSKAAIIQKLEKAQLRKKVNNFRVGDTVSVHTRIIEGEKERIQVFTGTVIARKGTGVSETFSLHRVAYGEGMERVFPLHSPRIAKIEVIKQGRVRRGKLYYLRGTSGKSAKVRGHYTMGKAVEEDLEFEPEMANENTSNVAAEAVSSNSENSEASAS